MPVAVAARDDDPVRAAVVGDRSVGAGKNAVHRIFEPEQAVAVPIDAADDVGRERAARVLAQILALGADLRELRRNRRGHCGIHRAREIDEVVVALQLLENRYGVRPVVQPLRHPVGDLAQPLGGVGRAGLLQLGVGELLADLDRLERQRAGFDRERQLAAVAVDDAAAHRLRDIGDLELTRRLRAQLGRAGHLEVEQLRRGQEQHRQDHHVSDPVPGDERRALGGGLDNRSDPPVPRGATRASLPGRRLCAAAPHAGGGASGALGAPAWGPGSGPDGTMGSAAGAGAAGAAGGAGARTSTSGLAPG